MFDLKYVLPFVTFGLGVLLIPHVERRKNKVKAKETYKNLVQELLDELEELPDRLRKMHLCLDNMNHWKKTGELKVGQSNWYVPREASCYFLKDTLEHSFSLLNKEKRYAAKSLMTQLQALNGYCQDIKNTENTFENRDELIKNYKRYLFTGCFTVDTMQTLANKSLGLHGKEDDEIVDYIFKKFEIDCKPEDLRIILTRTIES